MDERPERVWIHPNLKVSLSKLSDVINDVSMKNTGYPIPKGLPVSSKIASCLLDMILKNKNLIQIEKIDKNLIFDTKVSPQINYPIFLLIFNPKERIDVNSHLWDKGYLNLSLFKKKGIKENEIQFI